MQILPPKELSPYIKHYLFLESNSCQYQKLRLFSDGNTGMVFLHNQGHLSTNQNHYLPTSFLYGQISHFQDVCLIKQTSFIVVVFQPDGLYKLLGLSAHELKDQIVPTSDAFGRPVLALQETLMLCQLLTDKVYTLNNFFYELMFQRNTPSENLLPVLLQYVIQHKGLCTVEQLVRYSGYTERHIERIFGQQVGVSPKKFASIVQLHTFLKLLRSRSSDLSLTSIAYESGYFDQSHLIKIFKKHTGITPTEYLNGTNRIAVNFMELK
ncbi:helix-turn-helix transcriptional regulator [Sphingobacterium tabacisoli]|uniref:DUF6597 domain-containing transcriptional factor n=1 Tax=Sphingobacterium tabacisoli TaxID=2044855 RepID=A0ABW5L2X1_9SPHI|nr:helix-turn-helix transcriptional regulator [Sphingobacterium tabacisoli]